MSNAKHRTPEQIADAWFARSTHGRRIMTLDDYMAAACIRDLVKRAHAEGFAQSAEEMRERCAAVALKDAYNMLHNRGPYVSEQIAAHIRKLPLTEQPDNGQERAYRQQIRDGTEEAENANPKTGEQP